MLQQGCGAYSLQTQMHNWEFRHAKRRWCTEMCKNVIKSDESSSTSLSGWVHVWRTPREQHRPECLTPTAWGSGGSFMLWGGILLAWFGLQMWCFKKWADSKLSIVAHCEYIFGATFLLWRSMKNQSCLSPDTVIPPKRCPLSLRLNCAISSVFKLQLLQFMHQCRQVEFDGFMQTQDSEGHEAQVHPNNWCFALSVITWSRWVGHFKHQSGPLDLHIRPLVNVFPNVWTILWVSGWI